MRAAEWDGNPDLSRAGGKYDDQEADHAGYVSLGPDETFDLILGGDILCVVAADTVPCQIVDPVTYPLAAWDTLHRTCTTCALPKHSALCYVDCIVRYEPEFAKWLPKVIRRHLNHTEKPNIADGCGFIFTVGAAAVYLQGPTD